MCEDTKKARDNETAAANFSQLQQTMKRDCLPHKENGFCSSDFCLAKSKSLSKRFMQTAVCWLSTVTTLITKCLLNKE